MLLLLLVSGCLQQGDVEPEENATTPAITTLPAPQPTTKPPTMPSPKSMSIKILWNFTTGDNVYGVALAEDAEYAAVGSWDDHLYFLNKKGEVLWKFKAKGGIQDVAMTKDASYIAAISYTYDETTVHLIDKKGHELWNLALPNLSRGVDVSRDGAVAVASSSGRIILIKNKSILWIYTLEKSAWGAWDVVFAGDKVIAGDDNADIYVLSMEGKLLQKTRVRAKDYIYGVAAITEAGYIAAVTQDKGVYLFKGGKLQWKRQTGFSNYGVAISPDGGLVAVGSWDKSLYVYDIKGRLLLKHYVGDNVNRIVFSRKHLLFGSSDNRAYLLELE